MVFVTTGSCRIRLEHLTQLLVSAFPGSTIYQHTNPFRAPHDALNHKVDAVFLDAEMEKTSALDLMQMLRRQKPDIPVFILSESEALREQASEAGATGYFVLPVSAQQLWSAVQFLKIRRTYHDD